MCNVAGFIGGQKAAPVLLDMLSRLEGYAGGYHTGICTLHEGKLHLRKVEGSVADLLKMTDAAELPGNIGIAHTRPDMGGGAAHSHPFLSHDERLAYIVNGHVGYYQSAGLDPSTLAAEVLAKGGDFSTRFTCHCEPGACTHPQLSDGMQIHFTDLSCQLLAQAIEHEASIPTGIATAMSQCPSEIVGLMLHQASPGQIQVMRFNQPLTVAQHNGEMYLATTTLGLDIAQAQWQMVFPVSSFGFVERDRVSCQPLAIKDKQCCQKLPWTAAYEIISKRLKDADGAGIQDLKDATGGLWPKEFAPQKDFLVYAILQSMQSEGKIRQENFTRIGKHSGKAAAHTRFFLV